MPTLRWQRRFPAPVPLFLERWEVLVELMAEHVALKRKNRTLAQIAQGRVHPAGGRRVQTQFIAELRDRLLVRQMPPQDGDFLFRRVVLPLLLHTFSPLPYLKERLPPFPAEPEHAPIQRQSEFVRRDFRRTPFSDNNRRATLNERVGTVIERRSHGQPACQL